MRLRPKRKGVAMKFGTIDEYVLLGGGVLLAEYALELKRAAYGVLVITSPRHVQEMLSSEGYTLSQFLENHALEYFVSEEINKDQRGINRITSDTMGLSFGAAWIFRKEFIDRFDGKLLNLHGARLPQDRGAGGFSWQILRDNRLGGCLIHQVDPGVDTGPIVKYREFLYPTWCRIPRDYQQVYIQENRKFLKEFFKEVKDETEFKCIEQLEYLSTYWPRLSTERHGCLDWSWNLRQIERFICAFDDPYKGASTFINGKRVFLKSCFVDFSGGGFHPFQRGMVYRKSAGVLFVATEGGTLVIGSVTDESGVSIVNEVKVGDRFYTPIALLEKAMLFRAVYTPEGLKL